MEEERRTIVPTTAVLTPGDNDDDPADRGAPPTTLLQPPPQAHEQLTRQPSSSSEANEANTNNTSSTEPRPVIQKKGRFTLLQPAAAASVGPPGVVNETTSSAGGGGVGGSGGSGALLPPAVATAVVASSSSVGEGSLMGATDPSVTASAATASADSTVVTRKGRFTLVQEAPPPPPPQPPLPPPPSPLQGPPSSSIPTTVLAPLHHHHERGASLASSMGSLASSVTLPTSDFPSVVPVVAIAAAATPAPLPQQPLAPQPPPPPPPPTVTKKGRFVLSTVPTTGGGPQPGGSVVEPPPLSEIAAAGEPVSTVVGGGNNAAGIASPPPPRLPPTTAGVVVGIAVNDDKTEGIVPSPTAPQLPTTTATAAAHGEPVAAVPLRVPSPHQQHPAAPPPAAAVPPPLSSVHPGVATEQRPAHPAADPPRNGGTMGMSAAGMVPAMAPASKRTGMAATGPRHAAVSHAGRAGGAGGASSSGKMFHLLDQLRLEAMDADRAVRTLQTDIRLLRERNKELEAKARDVERKLLEERALREAAEAKLKLAKRKLREARMGTDSTPATVTVVTAAEPHSQQVANRSRPSSYGQMDLDSLALAESLSGEGRDDGTVRRRSSNCQGTTALATANDAGSAAASSPVIARRRGESSVTPPRHFGGNSSRGEQPSSPVALMSVTPRNATKGSPTPQFHTTTGMTEPGRSSAGNSPRNGQHSSRRGLTPQKLPPLPSNASPPGTIGSASGTSGPWSGPGASPWLSGDRPPLGASSAVGPGKDATLMQLSAAQAEARLEASTATLSAARSLAVEFDPLRPESSSSSSLEEEDLPSASASAAALTAAAATSGDGILPSHTASQHDRDNLNDDVRPDDVAAVAGAAPRVQSRSYPEQDWHWHHLGLQQPALVVGDPSPGYSHLASSPSTSTHLFPGVPLPPTTTGLGAPLGQHPSTSRSLPASAPVWGAVHPSPLPTQVLPAPHHHPSAPYEYEWNGGHGTPQHGPPVATAVEGEAGRAVVVDPFDELVRRSGVGGAAAAAAAATAAPPPLPHGGARDRIDSR